jgi:hypothetical protein
MNQVHLEKLRSFRPRRIGRARSDPYVSILAQRGPEVLMGDLLELEGQLGARLPDEYKEFVPVRAQCPL